MVLCWSYEYLQSNAAQCRYDNTNAYKYNLGLIKFRLNFHDSIGLSGVLEFLQVCLQLGE